MLGQSLYRHTALAQKLEHHCPDFLGVNYWGIPAVSVLDVCSSLGALGGYCGTNLLQTHFSKYLGSCSWDWGLGLEVTRLERQVQGIRYKGLGFKTRGRRGIF